MVHVFSDLEALRIAVEMERRGESFYRRAARVSRSEEARALLDTLARDEQAHRAEFEAQYARESKRQDSNLPYSEEVNAYLTAFAADIVFPCGLMALKDEGFENPRAVYLDAIASEQESILFYTEMTRHAPNAHARETFTEIIRQERAHLCRLSRQLDSYNKNRQEAFRMDAKLLYRQWLVDFADDAETVNDLRAIANDDAEIEDRFYRELEFGTAGMRGVLGAGTNRLNIYNVRRVSRALAKYILTQPGGAGRGVAIAFDSRHKSDVFAREAALVLAAAGVKAYLYDTLRPVPVLSFTVRHLKCIAGIVITASHNPSKYNGYKVYWSDGGQMPPESVKGITDLLPGTTYAESLPMDESAARAEGLLNTVPAAVDDAYIAAVKKLQVNPELAREVGKTLKIVYTPLHGSGNIPVRRILKEIGMQNVYVVPEQEKPDGDFPTVKVPNPEEPDAFRLALKLQGELNADLCIGTDPDCDRVGVACMTESGARLLNGNQIGCVLLHYILSQKKERGELPGNAAAVTTIVSTDMARAIANAYGCEMIEVLTGFKYIAEQIHLFETTGAHTFMFGFEESFGYLSGTDVRDKDGVNACMLIAEAACWYKKKYNKTLVDAIDLLYEQFGYYGDRVTSFVLPGKDGLEKMRELMDGLRKDPPAAFGSARVTALRDYQTGVRTTGEIKEALTLPKSNVLYFELENSAWICVRPSGTEPKIKLYVNAVSESAEKTQALLTEYSEAAVAALKARMN